MYDIKKMYEKKEYDKIIDFYELNFNNGFNDFEENYYLGLSLLELGYIIEAKELLEKAREQKTSYKKLNRYLGILEYILGNYRKSKFYFEIKTDNIEENLLKEDWLILTGFCEINSPIEIKETENIIYRFMDIIDDKNMMKFIDSYEFFYKRIYNLFPIKLNKKIDVYIYKKQSDSLGNMLCYANPPMAMIHTNYKMIGGHEIAHIFLPYIHDEMLITKFIDEGFAMYFDKIEVETFEEVKQIINKGEINILDYWEDKIQCSQKEFHLVSGAFISYLIECYGLDKLSLFLKSQSIDNLFKVYGNNIELNF